MYAALDLPAVYARYEEESYARLVRMIEAAASGSPVPAEVFLAFARKIYKRQK